MARAGNKVAKKKAPTRLAGYENLFDDVAQVLEDGRRAATRSANAVMPATYWLVGGAATEKVQTASGQSTLHHALEGLPNEVLATEPRGRRS